MKRSTCIVFYVSAHGLGHWAQVAPVMARLMRKQPSLRLILRSSLPPHEIRARLPGPVEQTSATVDVGVIQRDAISEDWQATLAALKRFHSVWEQRVFREAQWLINMRAQLVVSNISPLGLAAAQRVGLPNLALGSLNWHEVYAPFLSPAEPLMEQIRLAYTQCDLLLKLPLSMPMSAFPHHHSTGLIGRKPSMPIRETLNMLGQTQQGKHLALVMFGGSKAPPFELASLGAMQDWSFFMPSDRHEFAGKPGNVHIIDTRRLPIHELMALADVVVCKPGYGTLAEAWLTQTPVCYVPRPHFPEYPFLRDWLKQHAPSHEMPLHAFRLGDWLEHLDKVRMSPKRYPHVEADGDREAAKVILELASA
ncbi:MAG: hypothetical protein D6703_04910 [Zetaproteobacteria bacterium]|nr:MAG: hypothetical protein D6703_04910 [Zetaproteobacteria bacterium]